MGRIGKSRGLTLIELVVVLMVLIALAGILVPQLTGFVERSHGASGATNLGEVRKAVELYNVKYLVGYPDYQDSLLDTAGNLFSKLNDELTPRLTVLTLDAGQAQSLVDAGITKVGDHFVTVAPAGSATDSITGAERPIAALGKVAKLSALDATTQIYASVDDNLKYDYVVMGIGRNSTAIGKVMAEPPLDFEKDPTLEYSRSLLVFGIPKAGATVTFKAAFKGVLGREGDGIADHLNTYHKS